MITGSLSFTFLSSSSNDSENPVEKALVKELKRLRKTNIPRFYFFKGHLFYLNLLASSEVLWDLKVGRNFVIGNN